MADQSGEHRQVDKLDLLCWLVELGKTDREQYRVIREAMWALYATNSARSDKQSKCS